MTMTRTMSFPLLALLLSSGVALAEGPKADPSLADSVKKFTDTFNKFDAKATAAFWAEEGTLISPAGELGKGSRSAAPATRCSSSRPPSAGAA